MFHILYDTVTSYADLLGGFSPDLPRYGIYFGVTARITLLAANGTSSFIGMRAKLLKLFFNVGTRISSQRKVVDIWLNETLMIRNFRTLFWYGTQQASLVGG